MALTPAQQITQLYVGYFNRAPDPEGLNYWIGRLTATVDAFTIQQIAQSFSEQPETLATYPFLRYPNLLESDTTAFITEIYQNAFNRAPDAEGLAYWTKQLTSGAVPVGDFIASVISGATNSPAGQDLTTINNKTTVGLSYATQVADAEVEWTLETAHAALEGVDATQASVILAEARIAAFIETGYWPGTEPVPGVHEGTAGIVDLTAGEGLVAHADGNAPTDTYVSGTVNGTGDNVANFKLTGDIAAQVTLNDIPTINVQSGARDTSVSAKGWNGTQELNINQPSANITISDLQSAATQVNINDANRSAEQEVRVTYDAQGVIANDSAVNIGVRETFAKVSVGIDGLGTTSIDTINLTINDTEGFNSTLADVEGVNTKTLNIEGGYEGGKFTITGPLDATLTTIDASEVESDLDLNVTETFTALAATLGSGDDVLRVGDTLGTGDDIDGGEGNDRIIAEFTSVNDASRTPAISNVETLEVAFNANVQLNGSLIDENLATVDLNASSARADFDQFNAGLKTINVNGPLAQGLEVDYDGEKRADLTLNVSANISNVGNGSSVRVLEATSLAVQFQAASTLSSSIQVDDATTRTVSIVNQSTGDAVVNGDGSYRSSAIEDGDAVRTLTIATQSSGDLTVGGKTVASLADANSLQTLDVSAASNGDIVLGLVGANKGGEADDLEIVSIKAADYADITSYGIDADESDGRGENAAAVSRIDVTGGAESVIKLLGSGKDLEVDNESNVKLPNDHESREWSGYNWVSKKYVYDVDTDGHNWIQAGSVGAVNITTAGQVLGGVSESADLTVSTWSQNGWRNPTTSSLYDFNHLVGFDLEAPSTGSITVSGTGSVNGLWFEDEVVKTIDASGLAGGDAGVVTGEGLKAFLGADVANAVGATSAREFGFAVLTTEDASAGFTVTGSKDANYVVGTNSADTITGQGGNDLLIGNLGNDILKGGAGNDILFGDNTDGNTVSNSYAQVAFDYSHPSAKIIGGNDIIDGGEGNDIIIGGGQAAGGRDILTGGTGNDSFVFRIGDEYQGQYSETGKSGLDGTVKNDVITDFSTGADKVVFDIDGSGKSSNISFYDGTQWSHFIGNGYDSNVIIRQGSYSDDGLGTFTVSASGSDYQVLINENGERFSNPYSGNGQNQYDSADHEIALLDAVGTGSLSSANFLFV